MAIDLQSALIGAGLGALAMHLLSKSTTSPAGSVNPQPVYRQVPHVFSANMFYDTSFGGCQETPNQVPIVVMSFPNEKRKPRYLAAAFQQAMMDQPKQSESLTRG